MKPEKDIKKRNKNNSKFILLETYFPILGVFEPNNMVIFEKITDDVSIKIYHIYSKFKKNLNSIDIFVIKK